MQDRSSTIRAPYGSDPFSYDLKGELAHAERRRQRRYSGHPIVHYSDGSFEIPTLPVTAGSLRRHMKRFGVEGTETVAVEVGVTVAARAPSRRRRTTEILVQEAAELRVRGLIPAAIADVLNISDRRCRALLSRSNGDASRGSPNIDPQNRMVEREKVSKSGGRR
jgi:hypothetical protein